MHADQLTDPIAIMQATPGRILDIIESIGFDGLDEPYAPGKWPRRYVIAHLADTEFAMSFRLRQAVESPGSLFAVFDQDVWADHYARLDPSLAVEAFRSLRALNLAWLATLTMQDWLKEGFHPEKGTMSVDDIVRFLAEHDLNHLSQLEPSS